MLEQNIYFLNSLSPDREKYLKNSRNNYRKSNIFILNTFEFLIIGKSYDKGCVLCALSRYINTKKDRTLISHTNAYKNYRCFQFSEQASAVELAVKKISGEKINKFGQSPLIFIDKMTLEISKMYLTPDPYCPWCGNLPRDSKKIALNELSNVVRTINSTYQTPLRKESAKSLAKRIEKISLNSQLGIFNTLLDNFESPFPVAVANLPEPNGKYEVGVGRTTNIEDSRSIALIEGMERYAGFFPKGKQAAIMSSYCKISSSCIDPHSLILNEDSLSQHSVYRNEIFKFHEDQQYHWVYANDIVDLKTLLIPETYAYYGMTLLSEKYRKEIVAYEISNGCAAGSTLSESIFFGLSELVERDAFLTAWYTNRPIKKIVLDKKFLVRNEKLCESLKQFEKYYSEYSLELFDISVDTQIPVVLATATAKRVGKNKMNFMCAASCNVKLQNAVEEAMQEISGIFFELQKKFQNNVDEISELSMDMSKISTMEQHSLVYGYYKNLHFINFKKNSEAPISASKLETSYNKFSNDLSSNLKKTIKVFKRLHKSIFFVNQTTEEMKSIGMNCVKVIVPGLLPMTFGAKNVRISKLRINELEKYFNKKLSVRFIPHPFP